MPIYSPGSKNSGFGVSARTRPRTSKRKILADTWYADGIQNAEKLQNSIPRRLLTFIERHPMSRAITFSVVGLRSDVVVTTAFEPAATLCIVLYGLLGLRKLVLLEYIVHPPKKRRGFQHWGFLIYRQILLKRCLISAQVLTDQEVINCARSHRIPKERFIFIKWPHRFDDTPTPPLNMGRHVVASGRRTDWRTFFAAAEGSDWDITVVCTKEDLPLVRALANGRPRIRSEISAQEHQREVNSATVYVIPIKETGASIGQIRVMNANQGGVPLVASDVTGLRGYVDNSSAALVPPDDPIALRDAVDDLLSSPAQRERLRNAAESDGYTMAAYLNEVSTMVNNARTLESPQRVERSS
ncbi:glycosyltransferase [Gordonia otitidis]|uniref:Glycosyltransferase n=1 Tax=Gordonia otitidis (strain DSM 44809 / CCUG 52243 / JCM 12355 / NBRC 100426 / IFM 10032) TaxID=1108044 RepID=H5TKJ4_GORO1|nr:putative glycosyltransferase [Gordonia otitidis NBRC 100426]